MSNCTTRACIFLVCVFWSLPVFGQDPAPEEDVITAVKKGQPAPYDGQLFDTATAIRWGQWLQNCQERSQLALDREKSLCRIELDYQAEIASIQMNRIEELNKDLMARLKRSEQAKAKAEYERDNLPWYESAWFGLAVGVVGSLGLVYAGAQVF